MEGDNFRGEKSVCFNFESRVGASGQALFSIIEIDIDEATRIECIGSVHNPVTATCRS